MDELTNQISDSFNTKRVWANDAFGTKVNEIIENILSKAGLTIDYVIQHPKEFRIDRSVIYGETDESITNIVYHKDAEIGRYMTTYTIDPDELTFTLKLYY